MKTISSKPLRLVSILGYTTLFILVYLGRNELDFAQDNDSIVMSLSQLAVNYVYHLITL